MDYLHASWAVYTLLKAQDLDHPGLIPAPTCSRLCESVATNLVGQRLSGFTGITKAVRGAVEEALTRILTPRRSIDILREVQIARQKGKPYTIVFVGVNGVGKSTNLSKVAYWLLQNDMKVRNHAFVGLSRVWMSLNQTSQMSGY